VLYTAKCYWPDVDRRELERIAARAARSQAARYRGTLLFPDDSLVLCLFEAESSASVKRAADRAGIPCERVMQADWLAPAPAERSPR
jgi:hypothetical protein